MLTIVTTVRPLENPNNQRGFRNAIRSWRLLRPQPEILVFGKGKPAQKVIEAEGGRFVQNYKPYGRDRPYFDEFIEVSERLATHALLMYCTDHLIIGSGLMEILKEVSKAFPKNFIMVGQHMRLTIRSLVDFSKLTWERDLKVLSSEPDRRAGLSAKDFIIFRKPLGLNVPRFVMGYPRYDSWLVWAALKAGYPMVDITQALTPIHQNHEFPEGSLQARYDAPGSVYNHRLSETVGLKYTGGFGSMRGATHIFTSEGLVRRS